MRKLMIVTLALVGMATPGTHAQNINPLPRQNGARTLKPRAVDGSYRCTENAFRMTADITLRDNDSVDLVGTPDNRCTVTGNGHRFIVADSTWTGHFQLAFADVLDVGTSSFSILGGAKAGDYAYVNGGYIDIEHTTFHRSGGFNLYTVSDAAITFNNNEYAEDNLVLVGGTDEYVDPWFVERGASTARKYFQGNRVYRSWVNVGSPNWIVGASPDCSTTCDADGNIMVGRRVGIGVAGRGSYVAYNYSHPILDVTPDNPTWSQVYNVHNIGAGVVVEHNILHTGHWVASGIDGELRDNVLLELSPHQFARLGNGGSIHHNIALALYPGASRYGDARLRIGDSAFGLLSPGNNLAIYNNTLDARGAAVVSSLWVVDGAIVNSFRNNVVYRIGLWAANCPVSGCTSVVGPYQSEGFLGVPPARARYLDYNDFFYDPSSARRVTYDIGVAGRSLCQSGWGGHDLGTCPNGSVDPQFRGPLPIGSGQTGFGSPDDSGFPFNDADIVSGIYTVSQMLSYFRWVYAPATGSPLIGAQDPQDGRGDIGAVQTSDLPGAAPPIVITNKPPMVHAGPSFSVTNARAVSLSGYGADDGLPENNLIFQWSAIGGPGSVTFSDASQAMTSATFSADGLYTLRLTASDGALMSASDVQIAVGATAASPRSPVADSPAPPSNVRILR